MVLRSLGLGVAIWFGYAELEDIITPLKIS